MKLQDVSALIGTVAFVILSGVSLATYLEKPKECIPTTVYSTPQVGHYFRDPTYKL